MSGGMKGGNAEMLGSRAGEEEEPYERKTWASPRKIQALSLYSLWRLLFQFPGPCGGNHPVCKFVVSMGGDEFRTFLGCLLS